MLLLVLISLLSLGCNAAYDPMMWKPYLIQNRMPQCENNNQQPRLPKSYYATASYFDGIPKTERVAASQQYAVNVTVPACGNKVVGPDAMNAYVFQSERFLTMTGLNIYDGSLHSMALGLLGEINLALSYTFGIINGSATCQFKDIRGDSPCRGLIMTGQCADVNEIGVCGFCYGNGYNSQRTVQRPNALTFRMISDVWAFQGTVDQRCPEKQGAWTWNDYKPVLGENAWANFIGPLQLAVKKYGIINSIPDNDLTITMAMNILPTIVKMQSPMGAIFYSPRNTIAKPRGESTIDYGYDVSLENNISLLAGLKALRLVLVTKNINVQSIPIIDNLIANITDFVYESYDPQLGFFRQGGSYNSSTNEWTWAAGPSAFAVDCQTWTMSVIGPKLIDEWFGAGSALGIWNNTKRLGGYHYNFDGSVDGLGFSYNSQDQVFSGEWTLGAINMLKIFAKEFNDPRYNTEADSLRTNIQSKLAQKETIDGISVMGVKYANRRYWIPFGWFANPLLSTASTAWTVFLDSNWNPFYLGGEYRV
eukprot:TRINITY_DN8870_c0_g1_i1.p1 TRINITY_DN8870_c0_g1~~TRINITY_DN8870_c0_g1_i1.p1  ORF type:complete len:535 (+),score=91.76 TRINITY_DN8870_c0_g1_i1:1324-2928(+)